METIKLSQRQKRPYIISKIVESIKQASLQNLAVDYRKLIALTCLENGLSKRTCKEYIDLLIDSEVLRKEPDGLYFNFKEDSREAIKL